MYCRDLRFWRKAVCLLLAEDQEECVNPAHGCFRWIVNLCVVVTVLVKLLHTVRCACAQIIEPSEHDRFRGANLRARRHEPALLAIITERAFECATCVGQRFRSPVDHAEGARHDAIPTAVANIILHKNRANLSANDRSGGACFEATRCFAVFANVGEENPAKRIFTVA